MSLDQETNKRGGEFMEAVAANGVKQHPQTWAVVGGGILGMTLALRLRERGESVTLFEAAPEMGGVAAAWQIGDIVWDKHYHVTLLSDSHLRALLDDLGLTDRIRWVETKTGVFSEDGLFSVSNTIEFLRFPGLSFLAKARLGWTILYGSRIRNWRKLENVDVEAWLRRHSGSRATEKFWLPLLRSKLGDNYRSTSAAFIWATIQRLYAARRSGLKKEMFGYVRGGYATVLDLFVAALVSSGIELRPSSKVMQVSADEGGVRIDLDSGAEHFEKVVLTVASPIAAKLVGGLTDEEQRLLAGVKHQGIICASVLTEKKLSDFYVINLTSGDLPFTGVIEMSALVEPQDLGGNALIYLPRYCDPEADAFTWSDDTLRELFLSGLSSMFSGFHESQVKAFQVSRVRLLTPIASLGYSQRVPPMKTSVRGVYTVNASQILNGTLNVNETLQLAARALPVLLGDASDSVELLDRDVAPLRALTRQ
jgi:protoporphyrinogen oxidase